MNKIIILVFCLTASINVFSQIQVQSFFGNDGLQIGLLTSKPFTKNEKWNYYNYTSYFTEYSNVKMGQIEIYQNVSYTIYKNFGVDAGTTFSNSDLNPSVGLSYILEKDKYSVSVFPSISYSMAEKNFGSNINALVEFTPRINKSWNLYSMLIFNGDYFSNNFASKEFIRLGLEHKHKFQFGIGSDIDNNTKSSNIGVFVGYTIQK